MEPIKKNFKECDIEFLEETFNLIEVRKHNLLANWIMAAEVFQLNDFEYETLVRYQDTLVYRVNDWNEQELIEHFIGPLFALINFNTKEFGMFSERFLGARIGDYDLSGYPDAIVAKGRRSPKIPYFCFHEYKKEQENKGDPAGQCLAAMLEAQELNNNTRPIYGITVKGEKWQFMVLQGKEYAISNSYISTDEELYDIVKLLKHLKTIIEEYVKS